MSLSRKRKKELRKLQTQANSLWEAQQVLVERSRDRRARSEPAARQLQPGAGRPAGAGAGTTGTPRPTSTRASRFSKQVLNDRVVPAAGAVVGSALSVWDAANDTRAQAGLRSRHRAVQGVLQGCRRVPVKSGPGAGGVIAIILGVAAALGILYAAWQTLRADDELWVADDPLRAPDA